MKATPRTAMISLLVLAFMAAWAEPATVTLLSSNVVLRGLRNVYGATTLAAPGGRSLWMGGWLEEADVGREDEIFYSQCPESACSWPVRSFSKPGYLVNDASIIQHPVHGWLFMYYTALAASDAPVAPTERNVIGFASSIDGGRSWWDHGIILGRDDPAFPYGAWSPSALVVNGEIWVYFHDNFPGRSVRRARLNVNGWQMLDPEPLTLTLPWGHFFTFVNVDVSSLSDGRFLMLANDATLKNVFGMVSADGVAWSLLTPAPLISGSPWFVTSPHAIPEPDGFGVLFSLGGAITGFEALHSWRFRW